MVATSVEFCSPPPKNPQGENIREKPFLFLKLKLPGILFCEIFLHEVLICIYLLNKYIVYIFDLSFLYAQPQYPKIGFR